MVLRTNAGVDGVHRVITGLRRVGYSAEHHVDRMVVEAYRELPKGDRWHVRVETDQLGEVKPGNILTIHLDLFSTGKVRGRHRVINEGKRVQSELARVRTSMKSVV
jgi:hypothetical protein